MRRRLILAAALAAVATVGTVAAYAGLAQPTVVSTNPVDYTPNVTDGTVYAIARTGNTVVVGGSFTTVKNSTGTATYQRRNIFAYDITTGAVSSFAPALDGTVLALAAGPAGTIYVGGAFHYVNGVKQRGITQLNPATGKRIPAFVAAIGDGEVRTIEYANQRVIIGGNFASVNGRTHVALARLYSTSGSPDSHFAIVLKSPTVGRTKVEDTALSPDGRTLIAIGAIQSADGLPRAQIVMIDQSGPDAKVAAWNTKFYDVNCDRTFATYVREVDFSPTGNYFVVVTTGRLASDTLPCDTAARFETTPTGTHAPTWVNHTGGNSLFAVSITGPAVYVGGHEQWLDNPEGNKSEGPGAVSRPGIGAIDPTTGKAMAWNPTRARGVGVQALVATDKGLLVGSDTDQLGHEYHGRLGMFPLN
jgi:hypothetical protein